MQAGWDHGRQGQRVPLRGRHPYSVSCAGCGAAGGEPSVTDCPPPPQAQGTGLGQGLGFTWGCLSLELGLTWRQVHPGLRLSPREGGGDSQVRIPLRIRVDLGSEVSLGLELESSYSHQCITTAGAGVGIWNPPSTVSPTSPPVPTLRGAVHASATLPTGSMAQNCRPWL